METEKQTNRRRNLGTVIYQGLVLLLLCVLLVVGFFHYLSLSVSQQQTQADIQQIRGDYVKLAAYIKSQNQQDTEISNIKADIAIIQHTLRMESKGKK